MIYFKFSIENPLIKKQIFNNIVTIDKQMSKNKFLSIEICKYNYYLFSFSISTKLSGHDHAGPSIDINLLGFNLLIELYDHRHWDYANNIWKSYD